MSAGFLVAAANGVVEPSELAALAHVVGDAVSLEPTPGHTPGSLSLLIDRIDAAPVLLIGDLAYDATALQKNQLPGTGDKKVLSSTYATVRDFRKRRPDVLVVPSHDWDAAARL